jgi:hypothetical protein
MFTSPSLDARQRRTASSPAVALKTPPVAPAPTPLTRQTASHPATGRVRTPHALVMMLLVITAAAALTWVMSAGTYERTKEGLVVPGTFHLIPKD